MSRVTTPTWAVIIFIFGGAYLGAGALTAAAPQAEAEAKTNDGATEVISRHRGLLNRYCITCHNERLRTAGLTLDTLDLGRVSNSADAWERVVRKVRSGSMPPPGNPRPDQGASQKLVTFLESELDRAAGVKPDPGRPTLHRLNRTEYANAIRDLLAIQVDNKSLLPADDSGHGFDNIADVLSFSPGLLDRYMSAAAKISRLVVGEPTIRPVIQTYDASRNLVQSERMSDSLPFGSRGGMLISHYFSLDGEYQLKIRLQRTFAEVIRGLVEPNHLEVRLDGVRIASFIVGGGKFTEPERTDESSQRPKNVEKERYELEADRELEVRFAAKSGARLVGVSFVKATFAPEGMRPARYPIASFSHTGDKDGEMGVDSVEIAGPFSGTAPTDTASVRRVFICEPVNPAEEERCANRILSNLIRRAYRRPARHEDVQALLSFYKSGRQKRGFRYGIELALRRMLVDPEFLFRIERDPVSLPTGGTRSVNDIELASRLSFFLWSSIPDDELLLLAERGKLRENLEQQVKRMLSDPRSVALITNFAAQWLFLRNMSLVSPDPDTFPEFDDNLREAMRHETELFLESQLREDRSLVDLLASNYTFLNERLARHYGIPNIYGNQFRRVTLTDERRRGLLGHGSVLTLTSYSTRTSPVLRGKWLLENILGTPPPAPPPNIPDLKDTGEDGKPQSVRERMEQHRKNPVCASCHASMDPLGFALESYNAVGRWRTVGEASTALDTSGTLPDGTKFDGPAALTEALLLRRDQFVSTVTEKLLTYALGRGLEHYDAPAVRHVVRTAGSNDYRWSSIVLGIVTSTPFQLRRSES